MLITRQTCRSCGSRALTPVISLGDQILAGNFGFSEELPPVERKIPLDLVRCDREKDEHACGLVQLRHTVPGDLMYSSYGYQSGINELMRNHLTVLAHELEERVGLTSNDIVVDIGANDGTTLKAYRTQGFTGIGYEPSIVQPSDLPSNIAFIRDYFSASPFQVRFSERKAKIVTSIAMFYDLEEPNVFVSDVASILHKDGLWVIEVAYLPKTLERNSFDTICHEHLLYYSLSSIEPLLKRHGLVVADVDENYINGGTIRVYACHKDGRFAERSESARTRVYTMQRKEFEMKLDTAEPYDAFNERVARVRAELPALLRDLKSQGKVIYGYGASTKGNVTLQYCNIGPDLITAIADRNPAKWDQMSPGMNIPICSEEDMRAARPDYLLALPWPFLSAFMERESEFLARGGKFIVPMPEVGIEPSNAGSVVSSDDRPLPDTQTYNKKKRALITGAAGQDGTYLAALLHSKGYEVIGLDAPGRAPRTEFSRFIECDVSDTDQLTEYLKELRPDECYHLAAFHRSSAARDNESPEDTDHAFVETNLLSTQTLLRTLADIRPDCRVFLAGSCHVFGNASDAVQSERTPFAPTNMYGITKSAATHLGRIYRAKGMHVCTGILYNHESPLRSPEFITAKIARAAVDISRGRVDQITIGNLDAWVDWGFAGDYVEAMVLMLQAEKPEDFVIASGELHRIRDFVDIAFNRVGLDWRSHVREDAGAYRPVSRTAYHGDASAIRSRLGWEPKTTFKTLVEMMVDHYASRDS